MTKKASNPKAPNILLRNPLQAGYKPVRRVRHSEVLTQKEEEAVLKFYEELAPEAILLMVDIDMIVNQAYPVFERELGTANWCKVQRYFGIGGKKVSKNVKAEEVMLLVAKLRTIENAQYYLYGFSKLIDKYAAKLSRTPEGMTAIEKAKVVRMFILFFGGYLFFSEDYVWQVGKEEGEISFAKAMQINKLNIYPEEMFYLYSALIKKYSDGSFLYDAIIEEIRMLDKRLRKEILDVAELRFEDKEVLVSTNEKHVSTYSFGYVRNLKTKLFPSCGYFPNELFFVTDLWKGIEFGELYNVYKKLTENEFSSFEKTPKVVPHVEGERFLYKKFDFKIIAPSVEMSSEDEAKRYVRFIEFLARKNFKMPIDLVNAEDKKEVFTEDVEVGKFFAFLRFAHFMEYLKPKSSASEEYNKYLTLLELDPKGENFAAYMREEISEEELKSRLKITKEFEERELGIKHVETPMKTIKRFAIEKGYVSEESFSETLAENVLLHQNEAIWTRFSSGEIAVEKLIEKLGLDLDIVEMYFDLSKIDIQVLEHKLQDLKNRRVSNKEMKRNALTIVLYCYIIEGQIACGPKNKVPKGNKRLKPENLKKILAD